MITHVEFCFINYCIFECIAFSLKISFCVYDYLISEKEKNKGKDNNKLINEKGFRNTYVG